MRLPPEQLAIVYDDGSRCGRVYDTAYNAEQGKQVMGRCIQRYGRHASVRVVQAKKHYREVL